jgi:hypothetical protein
MAYGQKPQDCTAGLFIGIAFNIESCNYLREFRMSRTLCGHRDFTQQELELRSLLLTRIATNTYRPGRYNPELSAHSWVESD